MKEEGKGNAWVKLDALSASVGADCMHKTWAYEEINDNINNKFAARIFPTLSAAFVVAFLVRR